MKKKKLRGQHAHHNITLHRQYDSAWGFSIFNAAIWLGLIALLIYDAHAHCACPPPPQCKPAIQSEADKLNHQYRVEHSINRRDKNEAGGNTLPKGNGLY